MSDNDNFDGIIILQVGNLPFDNLRKGKRKFREINGETKSQLHEPRTKKTKLSTHWNIRSCISPSNQVNSLEDFLYMAWNYKDCHIDERLLWELIPPLIELNNMVGLDDVKQSILDMILCVLQGYHEVKEEDKGVFHTVLYGDPGCGKTRLAHILAKIYCKMGILKSDKVICAKRSDFIGKYIGHSEANTERILKDSLGGVLFIDEAYSMGSKDVDSFSKASVDLINQFLYERRNEMICVIAGYEKEMEENFFAINPGLRRRFAWKYYIKRYNHSELFDIFKRKVLSSKWSLTSKALKDGYDLFKNNITYFPNSGGDVENYFTMCRVCHSRRMFVEMKKRETILTYDDLKTGMDKFKLFRKEKNTNTFSHLGMYA